MFVSVIKKISLSTHGRIQLTIQMSWTLTRQFTPNIAKLDVYKQFYPTNPADVDIIGIDYYPATPGDFVSQMKVRLVLYSIVRVL